MGYETPTPIQEQAIPLILDGKDLIGCAQTGTGKTAAFLLPVMHRIQTEIMENDSPGVKCLIVAPTRELAQQIDQLVAEFYRRARKHPVLGPVFTGVVVEGDSEWRTH